MAVLKSEKEVKEQNTKNLFKDYNWFYTNLYAKLEKALQDYFKKDFHLKFMGIFKEADNFLFYGDEYFVNKIDINKYSSCVMRISASLVSSLLDNTLGTKEGRFSLRDITHIEAELIKSFTLFAYKNISEFIDKSDVHPKIVKKSKDYHFTFYVRYDKDHAGKIIITVPEYVIKNIEVKEPKTIFGIEDYLATEVSVNIGTGWARVPLNDVRALEEGDVLVLDNSDINKMFVLWKGKKYTFSVTPNPSIIISVDNNGGNIMEEETSVNPQNMWDSILVDVVAEFDNVKLTLGELKQISEGLVIDVGSVYDNKIKLRVENQIVATGELVILNDRYGVRIDSVKKHKDTPVKPAAKSPADTKAPADAKKPATQKPTAPAKKPVSAAKTPAEKKPANGDENFDYSDFEIEDESI